MADNVVTNWERVLDGRVVGYELGGRLQLGHAAVLGRKVVALKAEVARPVLGAEVHLTEGIEDGAARVARAHDRIVVKRRQVGPLLDRIVQAAERHDEPRRLQLRRRPRVPAEAHAVAVLVLLYELLVSGHLVVVVFHLN